MEEPRNKHRTVVGKAQVKTTLGRTKHEDNIKIHFREIGSEDLNSILRQSVHFCAGLYTMIGFSDKLQFMVLTLDDIHPCREFPVRGCRECCFSNNGHLFAAVNGNTIQVYSSVSFENLYNLKGHNGKVHGNADALYSYFQLSSTVIDWLWADSWQGRGPTPGHCHVQTSSGVHPASYSMGAKNSHMR
jgi:hypothetical protein